MSTYEATEKRDPKAQARADKAYKKAMRPWYKKKRFILPLLLLALFVLIGALSGGESDSAADPPSSNAGAGEALAEEAPAEEEPPAEPEPAQEVTAAELISTLEGNAAAAKSDYEGKRVAVSGVVGSIDASGDYFALDPEPDAFILTGVQVQTSEEFLDQVTSFTAGQEVTVTGTITSVGEVMGYSLEAENIE